MTVGSHSLSCENSAFCNILHSKERHAVGGCPKALARGRSSSVCTHSTDRVRSSHEILSYRWVHLPQDRKQAWVSSDPIQYVQQQQQQQQQAPQWTLEALEYGFAVDLAKPETSLRLEGTGRGTWDAPSIAQAMSRTGWVLESRDPTRFPACN